MMGVEDTTYNTRGGTNTGKKVVEFESGTIFRRTINIYIWRLVFRNDMVITNASTLVSHDLGRDNGLVCRSLRTRMESPLLPAR